jgi:hypothetical protein
MIHPCLFSGIVVIRSKQQGDDVGHKGKKKKKEGSPPGSNHMGARCTSPGLKRCKSKYHMNASKERTPRV